MILVQLTDQLLYLKWTSYIKMRTKQEASLMETAFASLNETGRKAIEIRN